MFSNYVTKLLMAQPTSKEVKTRYIYSVRTQGFFSATLLKIEKRSLGLQE